MLLPTVSHLGVYAETKEEEQSKQALARTRPCPPPGRQRSLIPALRRLQSVFPEGEAAEQHLSLGQRLLVQTQSPFQTFSLKTKPTASSCDLQQLSG